MAKPTGRPPDDVLCCCIYCGSVYLADIVANGPINPKKALGQRTFLFRGKPCGYCFLHRKVQESEYRLLEVVPYAFSNLEESGGSSREALRNEATDGERV